MGTAVSAHRTLGFVRCFGSTALDVRAIRDAAEEDDEA